MAQTQPIPQPKTDPFIGNLRSVDGDAPIQGFMRLAQLYGPIYQLDLGFHPDCLPVRLEEFERATDNGPDLFVRQRTLSPDRRVTLVRERARRGIVGLRWEYA